MHMVLLMVLFLRLGFLQGGQTEKRTGGGCATHDAAGTSSILRAKLSSLAALHWSALKFTKLPGSCL